MVNTNKIVPDPPDNTDENFATNHENIIMGTDSDTDDDDVALDGYEPLPLGPVDDVNEESSDSDDDSGVGSGGQHSSNENLPPINPIEGTLVREVWASPRPFVVDIAMDSEKVDEVKQAMAGITLPASAIPEWASSIPEEQWKQHLINRLQNLQGQSK